MRVGVSDEWTLVAPVCGIVYEFELLGPPVDVVHTVLCVSDARFVGVCVSGRCSKTVPEGRQQ